MSGKDCEDTVTVQKSERKSLLQCYNKKLLGFGVVLNMFRFTAF